MYTVFLTGGIGSGKSTVCDLMRQKGARVVDLDQVAHEVLREPQVMRELADRFGDDVLEWPEGFDACWIAAGAGVLDCSPCPSEADWEADPDACLADWKARFAPSRACTLVEAGDPVDGMCQGSGDYAAVNRALLAERAFANAEETAALNAITHPRILERLGEILTGVCCMGVREKVTVVEVPLIEASREALVLADEVVTVACPVELRRLRAVNRGMDPADFDARDARQATDAERIALSDAVFVNDGDEAALAQAVDAWWAARAAAGWGRGVPAAPEPLQGEGLPAEGAAAAQTVGAAGASGPAPEAPSEPSAGAPALRSPAIAFVGRHNSGKTTLVVKVIAELAARGVDVGSVKHHGHAGFEIDVPGKDSWRHREAGANEVAVCSPDRLALMRELDEPLEASEVVNLMRSHDVVVVEGYRHSGIPTIEVMRAANERDAAAAAEFLRAAEAGDPFSFDAGALGRDADRMPDRLTVGVASDIPAVLDAARAAGMQAFSLDDAPAIADYIEREVAARRP